MSPLAPNPQAHAELLARQFGRVEATVRTRTYVDTATSDKERRYWSDVHHALTHPRTAEGHCACATCVDPKAAAAADRASAQKAALLEIFDEREHRGVCWSCGASTNRTRYGRRECAECTDSDGLVSE